MFHSPCLCTCLCSFHVYFSRIDKNVISSSTDKVSGLLLSLSVPRADNDDRVRDRRRAFLWSSQATNPLHWESRIACLCFSLRLALYLFAHLKIFVLGAVFCFFLIIFSFAYYLKPNEYFMIFKVDIKLYELFGVPRLQHNCLMANEPTSVSPLRFVCFTARQVHRL